MRKHILVLLIQILFTIVLCGQTVLKYTSTNLNLRTGPNTPSMVLTVLPRGTEVLIEEDCDCEWILVSYSGNVGYVYSRYLTNEKVKSENIYSKKDNKNIKYYTNSSGERVQSPTYYNSTPAGATALCRDGTYSFSRSRRGTCSHHGGVARWL